ncbi:MAG: response regulator [Magnetococcales bacterium]|nr:response regulator [Magnetococcales bacterium]
MTKQYRLLLVDDVAANLKVLAAHISPDYQLSIATDGYKALKAAASNPPDLILLDIDMPGMDGFAVLEQLKANPLTQHIPVVFLTSHDTSEDILKGLQAGAYYYLTKPFDADILRLVIAKALRDDTGYAMAEREVNNNISTLEWLNYHNRQ